MDGLGLIAALVVLGVIAFIARAQVQAAKQVWRGVAKELGLVLNDFFSQGLTLAGRLRGFEVYVERACESRDKESRHTRIRIDGEGRIAPDIAFSAETTWTSAKKLFAGEDVLVGERFFDQDVHVQGNETAILAVLDERTRRAIQALVASSARVESGDLICEFNGTCDDAAQLRGQLNFMVGVATRLAERSADLPQSLEENAREDSEACVRLRNLRELCDTFAKHPATLRALKRALDDEEPSIRLFAASQLPDEDGFRVLRGLLGDSAVGAGLRARAFGELARAFPYERIASFVAPALASSLPELRTAAIRAAASARDASVLPNLCEPRTSADAETAREVAIALRQFEDPRAEARLIAMVQAEPSEVRLEAVRSLGRVGTVRAVEPLLPLTKGVLGDLKQEARDAVRRIQAKLGPADGGRLSLVDDEVAAGGLSLAKEDGALSLSEPARQDSALKSKA